MWAVVPLKSPDRAKSRLAGVLGMQQRRRLFFALAEHVIRALQATRGIDTVAVVTASPDVTAFAHALGVQPIHQAADFGMASAFASAVRQLQFLRLKRLLMIAGDLPLISPVALEPVIAAADANRGIVVVPDRNRLGTNALLCTPPNVIAPCFGDASFRRHLDAAEAAGVTVRVVEHEALALDLDAPADLDYLRTYGKHLPNALHGAVADATSPHRLAGADR
jgi:2-phospho-L-lactate guanylyltransferase